MRPLCTTLYSTVHRQAETVCFLFSLKTLHVSNPFVSSTSRISCN